MTQTKAPTGRTESTRKEQDKRSLRNTGLESYGKHFAALIF